MNLDEKIKDAEELFKQLGEQEQQMHDARQQVIGRVQAYQEMKQELQPKEEKKETE